VKKLENLIRVCSVGFLAIVFASGCHLASDSSDVLTMGTSADYEPFEFYDLENDNEIIGFDVDLAEYIAKELGYELHVIDMDFNSLTTALRTGRVDIVLAGMSATPDRAEVVDFTDAYYSGKTVLVTTHDVEINQIEDLNGIVLGVQTGSIQEAEIVELQAEGIDVKLNSLNRLPDLFQQLNSGRVEAVALSTSAIGVYLNNDESLKVIDILNPGESPGSAIALAKDSELTQQINEILKEMIENGELEILIEKWF